MCKLVVQTGMCKLVCANWYVQTGMCKLVVQTGMCKLVCANWYVQNDIFACNFLNNGLILMNFFFVWKLLISSFNSTSACATPRALREAPRALVECYVQDCYVQTGCANWYVQNDIFASNFLNNRTDYDNFFFVWKLLISSFNFTCASATPRALVELHERSWSATVQTAMCKLVVQTVCALITFLLLTVLDNAPILIILFLLESSTSASVQLHERSWSSTSARGVL